MKDKISYPLPWSRILARWIDTMLFFILIQFFLPVIILLDGLVFKLYGPTGGDWIYIFVWSVLKPCIILFYESFFLSQFSATLGKALMGFRVIEQVGRNLSFFSALSRSIRVCAYLYLCFIPYISLFLPVSCFIHLYVYKIKSGKFIWDRNERWLVVQKKEIKQALKLITSLLLISLSLIMIIFTVFAYLSHPAERAGSMFYECFKTFFIYNY